MEHVHTAVICKSCLVYLYFQALLDLLDQVGDVLSVDEPACDGAKNCIPRGFDDEICTRSGTAVELTEAKRKPSTPCFLVLEV